MNLQLGEKSKQTLITFVEEIRPRLERYFEGEYKIGFGYNQMQKKLVVEMLDHGKEYLLRPQKRLRPSFVCYAYRLGGKELTEEVWRAAMGVEITHAAILMHDDFMDSDDMRRGGPTTHKYFRDKSGGDVHFGDSMGVMEGDALLCIGFELVASANNLKATKQMLRTVTNTVYGQVYDIELERLAKWQEDDVINLHKAKTGFYTYRNPLFVGAMLAGIEDTRIYKILEDYAMDGGVAFQLQDDILGVYGTPEKTGKSADSDLKQGKCTLMVLKTYELGSEAQQAAVRKVWGNTEASRSELDAAKQAMMDCGAYDYNKKAAQEYARKAAETADKLRQFGLNDEAIDYIQGVAEYMVEREV